MGGQSRIKFNPVTKEIEIEGSEKFVKAYFDKLQSMLSGKQEAVAAAPVKPKLAKAVKEKTVKEKAIKEKPIKGKPAKKVLKSKKAQIAPKEYVSAAKSKKGGMSKTVLALIQNSPEGITTTELEDKTGLKDKQIWAIISNAKKVGKIKQAKRGLYVRA